MLTLQIIYDAFGEEKKDISDVGDDLFIGWMNEIADFLFDLKRDIDPEQFILGQNYTVTSSPQSSALPDDFLGMQEFGTGVFLIDANGNNTNRELMQTGFGSSEQGYYLDGDDNIVFTGMTSGSYKLRYIPEFVGFSAMGDYFSFDGTITGKRFLPDSKLKYIKRALDVCYSLWDEDVSAEMSADQRFIRELTRAVEKDRRNSMALVLPSISNFF